MLVRNDEISTFALVECDTNTGKINSERLWELIFERVWAGIWVGSDASTPGISFMGKTPAHLNISLIFQAVGLHSSLTWSDHGSSIDSCDTAAHVYSSDFCDCRSVCLLSYFKWTVGGTGLSSCGGLGSLAGILNQWGRLNGHRALLQTESLQGLSLRGGCRRHLLATDGQILDLILAKTKRRDIIYRSLLGQNSTFNQKRVKICIYIYFSALPYTSDGNAQNFILRLYPGQHSSKVNKCTDYTFNIIEWRIKSLQRLLSFKEVLNCTNAGHHQNRSLQD